MKRTPLSLLRFALRTGPAAAALLGLAPSLLAADRFWIAPLGGLFSDINNWSATNGGAGGASVPGAADIGNFTLNNTYTVIFLASTTNIALDGENGNVTLNLGGFTSTVTGGAGASLIGNVSGQTGRLTVRNGTLAVDTLSDDVIVGSTVGATGFLTVTTGGIVGTAALRPEFLMGRSGTGTLAVNDNGRVFGQKLTVGSDAGAAGTVTITGPNAVADLSDTTMIGSSGTGTLSVNSGGTLVSALAVSLGDILGADGTASVSGVGSSWTMSSTTTIGNAGDGTLTISSGGLVSSASAVAVAFGNSATGFGTATVTGAGSRWNLGAELIGVSGLGVMTVSSGGQVVSSSSAFLGVSPGSEGRVTVTGAGTLWTTLTGINVGSSGTGDLMVSGGGEVSTSSVTIGDTANGVGVVTVTGAGSKLTTVGNNLTVANLGAGTLNVSGGAEVYVGANLTVNNPAGTPLGTLNLEGGSIFVTGNFANNGVFNFTDGLLQVKGAFQPSPAAVALTIDGSDSGDLPTVDLIGSGTTTNVTVLQVGDDHRGQLLLRQGRVLNVGTSTIGIGGSGGAKGSSA